MQLAFIPVLKARGFQHFLYNITSGKLMMKREFNVIIERDADGYFVASVPNLPGCHTQAKTLDELIERIREAIELCLEFEEEQQDLLDFVGIQRVAVDI
ncbi:type II toxin-antitoxin system HicB family antitoxin [Nostoc sp. XA010]|uniref:type II toxin-antitoxin system HicB family antitoxin n=1 Tax=Nostoc sp. XA010 TaxID=2780407 RepID=UPI001E419A30|nr:type II toxin-antitoxin system HicB family antitoxin [Nostoc sp. XA010]MCC5657375.1 type II toxin-antitoxin system HicB family antitoxin [Nostoc sp. XA010]